MVFRWKNTVTLKDKPSYDIKYTWSNDKRIHLILDRKIRRDRMNYSDLLILFAFIFYHDYHFILLIDLDIFELKLLRLELK